MGALDGEIKLPVVGSAPKKVVVLVGGAGAVFVLWRWWVARDSAGYDPEGETDEFGDAGTIPSVDGAYRPDGDYGLDDDDDEGSDSYGFKGTKNTEWTQYVTTRLSQSERWDYQTIVSALGVFLNHGALSDTQVEIVQAAIAEAGQPPEGSYTLIPGGNSAITVAPSGLRVVKTGTTYLGLTWQAVPGATGYRIFRSGASQNVGDSRDTDHQVGGLSPDTTYQLTVQAYNKSGAGGPKSTPLTAKTARVKLGRPRKPTASSVKATSLKATTGKVSGATYYRWYVNGRANGSSDGPSRTIGGLKPRTRYKITVRADTTNQEPGPESSPLSVTTKRK